MAATAVYVNVGRVPQARGDIDDNQKFTNISATTAAFSLDGGKYGLTVKGSTYGTVTFQVLAQDGTTWLNVSAAIIADGYSTYDCQPGAYRIAIA